MVFAGFRCVLSAFYSISPAIRFALCTMRVTVSLKGDWNSWRSEFTSRSCQGPQLGEMLESKVALTAGWRSRNVRFSWLESFLRVDISVRGNVVHRYLLLCGISCRVPVHKRWSGLIENSICGGTSADASKSEFLSGFEAWVAFRSSDCCSRALFVPFGHVRRVRHFDNEYAFSKTEEPKQPARETIG